MPRYKIKKKFAKLPRYARIGSKYVYIGKFNVDSGKIIVSDPSYENNKKCSNNILKNVKNGKWYSFVYVHLHNDGDDRNAVLYVFHSSVVNKNKFPLLHHNDKWKKISSVGVDTAQMAICDYKHFRNDNDVDNKWVTKCDCGETHSGNAWYNMVCASIGNNYMASVINGGTISMTGWGDGTREAFVLKNDNFIIGIKVIFEK